MNSATLQNLANIGTFAASLATVSLVIFGLVQLILLRRQVILTQDQAGAAKDAVLAARESVEAAREAVAESARVRVDERAPRIVALMEEPEWPPRVDRARSQMPYANELRLLDHRSVAASSDAGPATPFVFDGQKNWFMWFRMRGVLINEGSGTARVRLDGEAQFIEGTSILLRDRSGEIGVPPMVGTKDRKEYLLRPGDVALFEWGYGHTLGEWADAYEHPDPPNPRCACFLTVTIMDFFEHGVIDHIFVEMGARPIRPVPQALGQWVLREPDEVEIGMTVYPMHRTYRFEGWKGVDLRGRRFIRRGVTNTRWEVETLGY